MSEYKICKTCGLNKLIKSFALEKGKYRRSKCNSCIHKLKTSKNPELYRLADNKRHRNQRVNKVHIAILQDCNAQDRKKRNSKNDLNHEFIIQCIANGCFYCGELKLRMTLDRIDNTKSHNQNNVIPACIRCNLLRGSMPYEAWKHFIPIVKKVRELDLFGSFLGR